MSTPPSSPPSSATDSSLPPSRRSPEEPASNKIASKSLLRCATLSYPPPSRPTTYTSTTLPLVQNSSISSASSTRRSAWWPPYMRPTAASTPRTLWSWRAIKDFPRRRGEVGSNDFSAASPRDCLAYKDFRLSREVIKEGNYMEVLEKAMEEAETKSARKIIEEEMERTRKGEDKEGEMEKEASAATTVPVVRLIRDRGDGCAAVLWAGDGSGREGRTCGGVCGWEDVAVEEE